MRLPADGLAHASLGPLYLTLERPDLAYACLGLACAAYPEAGYLRGLLADAAIQNGHLDVGERLLAEVESLGLHDPFGTALRVRADLAAARGEDEQARELYERLMAHPRTPAGIRHYVRFLEAHGEIEDALRVHLGSTDGDRAVLLRLAEAWWQSCPSLPRRASSGTSLTTPTGASDRCSGSCPA